MHAIGSTKNASMTPLCVFCVGQRLLFIQLLRAIFLHSLAGSKINQYELCSALSWPHFQFSHHELFSDVCNVVPM
jgi:hypothetical protein